MMQVVLQNFHRFRSVQFFFGEEFVGLLSLGLPIHAPSLQSFKVDPFHDASLASFLDFLRPYHSLSFMDVSLAPPTHPRIIQYQSRLILPSLQTLKVETYKEHDLVSPFLDAISIPALKTLTIFTTMMHADLSLIFNALQSFFGYNSLLGRFSFDTFDSLESPGFISLLSRLSNLHFLML